MKQAVLTLGVALLAPSALAQSYAIDWITIDGGGGTSTGGVYSVSSTIGQPDADAAKIGGKVSLVGGFWPLFAVRTPGAPLLSIVLTGTNTAIVSWPSDSTGFTLQERSDPGSPIWGAPAESITDNGTNRFVIISPPSGHRYYRLIKP